MRTASVTRLLALALTAGALQPLYAQSPRNLGVTYNDDGADPAAPLAANQWHTVTARYRYPGRIGLLTNTYLVFCRGNNQLSGFYIGYNLPAHELAIVKHGFWNAQEATGKPGEAGKVIENDQGYLDCEHTRVERTDDEISVVYRLKFKPDTLQGLCAVFQYIEDKDINYEGFTNVGSVTVGKDLSVHRTDMPRAWENALRPGGRKGPKLLLADHGQALCTLVIPAEPKRVEQKAASDLALHLKLISGADVPIVREGAPVDPGRVCISLGRTKLLQQSAAAWKDADLAVEGYAIEVVGTTLFVYGGSGRGLPNGVYALLEEDLGCRWYSRTSVDTPSLTTLAVSPVPRTYAPALELRDPYILSMHDANWSLKNRTNTPHARIPMDWGGSLRYYLMGHTYATYFPTQKYFAEHPEYYALVNGKRQPTQLCQTNEDVIRLSIEKTCEIFREHPDVTITAIGPNDGRGFCDCPDCTRLNDANGGRSGSYFSFLNRIAEGVKKEFPGNHIISLAYLDYARPPTHLKVDDYIIIQLCSDSHAWRYQFCGVQESEEFQGMLKAWEAAKATVYLWDYATDYVHYLVPMANWAVVAENTRFNVRHGVKGIMFEAEATDNDDMRAWVWAKQLWDPRLDTLALMKDFVFGYYKEAAPPIWDYERMMWDYREKWHKVPHRCGQPSDNPLLDNLQCSYAPDGPMFTPEFMAAMRASFAAAEQAAASDEIRTRVRKAKLPLLYLELAQNLGYYTEFGDFSYGRRIRESRAAKESLRPLLDEFVATARAEGLSTLGIPITLDRISAKWQACIERDGAAVPKLELPAKWLFAADREDQGVTQGWPGDQRFFDEAARRTAGKPHGWLWDRPFRKGLSWLHVNRGVGWEQQGFAGLDGYGWYFQNLTLPEDVASRAHVYLYFLGVNEQVWIYVNGELACERTYASTGKAVGDLWATPFSADVRKYLVPGGPNRVAIRVTHSSGLGGIWLPAMAFGTDDECTTEQLGKLRD